MKLLFIIYLIFNLTIKGQSWCAQGATWHYKIYVPIFYPYQNGTLKLSFTNTVSINSIACDNIKGVFKGIIGTAGSPTTTNNNYVDLNTYENNNTVYLYNPNTLIFDTIANFNSSIGDKWLLTEFPNPSFPPCSFNRPVVTVIDTGHTSINSNWLKKIVVNYTVNSVPRTDTIIKKMLCVTNFLFPSYHCIVDGPNYGGFICYSDINLGLHIKTGYTVCEYIPTGIDENIFSKTNFLIYPNPIKDFLNFEFNSSLINDMKTSITNSLGQIVFIQNILTSKQELDLSFLASGIYYLKVQSNSEQKVFKIIKE